MAIGIYVALLVSDTDKCDYINQFISSKFHSCRCRVRGDAINLSSIYLVDSLNFIE